MFDTWSPQFIAGTVSTVVAVVCLIVALKCKNKKGLLNFIALFWLVVPPVYFFFEFHYYRHRIQNDGSLVKDEKQRQIGDLKDSEELGSRIWVGVAAALGALALREKK